MQGARFPRRRNSVLYHRKIFSVFSSNTVQMATVGFAKLIDVYKCNLRTRDGAAIPGEVHPTIAIGAQLVKTFSILLRSVGIPIGVATERRIEVLHQSCDRRINPSWISWFICKVPMLGQRFAVMQVKRSIG